MWPTVNAASATASSSSSAVSVTVCSRSQFPSAVKVSVAGRTSASAPPGRTGVTVTGAEGRVASPTVQVAVAPSATSTACTDTVSPGASSSTIVTATRPVTVSPRYSPPATVCEIPATGSVRPSSSDPPVTVTVFGVSQSSAVKVSVAGETSTSVHASGTGVTVTLPSAGSLVSATV